MPMVSRPNPAAIDHRNTVVKSGGPVSGAATTASSEATSGSSARSSVIDMPNRLRPAHRLARSEDAELVALGVGQHDPGHVVTLAHVDVPGTHVDQPLDLGVAIVRIEVDVQPVLAELRVVDLHEHELRVGLAGRRDDNLLRVLEGDVVVEHLSPPAPQPPRVEGVDDDGMPPAPHANLRFRGLTECPTLRAS